MGPEFASRFGRNAGTLENCIYTLAGCVPRHRIRPVVWELIEDADRRKVGKDAFFGHAAAKQNTFEFRDETLRPRFAFSVRSSFKYLRRWFHSMNPGQTQS